MRTHETRGVHVAEKEPSHFLRGIIHSVHEWGERRRLGRAVRLVGSLPAGEYPVTQDLYINVVHTEDGSSVVRLTESHDEQAHTDFSLSVAYDPLYGSDLEPHIMAIQKTAYPVTREGQLLMQGDHVSFTNAPNVDNSLSLAEVLKTTERIDRILSRKAK